MPHTSTKPSFSTLRRTLFVALVLAFCAAPAHAQLGIAGGLNFETADDLTNATGGGEAALDNSTGFHAGVVYEFGFGPLNVRPGLIFRRVGTYQFDTGSLSQTDFDVSAIEVPIDVRVTVVPLPVIKPYLLVGPQFSFVQGEDEFDDATEDLAFSLNVGAGTDIQIPGVSLILQPELRYEFGASAFLEDEFEIAGQSFSPQDDPNFSAISLRLNVLF